MVLVDTSVWVDYFNGTDTPESNILDSLVGSGTLLTGDLILAELLQGFARNADYRRAQVLLAEIPYADLVGREVALATAENYRHLRARGITIRKTIDVIIGTFCILHGHELLHADRDYDAMEKHLGLRVLRTRMMRCPERLRPQLALICSTSSRLLLHHHQCGTPVEVERKTDHQCSHPVDVIQCWSLSKIESF